MCAIETVFVFFNTIVHFDTCYNKKSLIYWALGKAVCFVIPRPGVSLEVCPVHMC